MPANLRRTHLVGVGGAGMSGIARMLLARGAEVSGSDVKDTRVLHVLAAAGAQIAVGHDARNVGNVDCVVASTAIRPGNPEIDEATRRGIPVLPRAAALAALMEGYRDVAVAGTHGKTTTTSMLTVALQHCGADPAFVIGGSLNEAGSNAHAGTGDVFVAEADESDSSFLLLRPHLAIVTNVEWDHLDHFRTPADVAAAFSDFVGRVRNGGGVVLCADDPGARRLEEVARMRGLRVTTYGQAPDADLRLLDIALHSSGSRATVVARGRTVGQLTLRLPGLHNVSNAAGALGAGLELGMPAVSLLAGLSAYSGVRRRFEAKGVADGVRVIDDYAHHPTEVVATLRAARLVCGEGRVVVVFQPHRYSRTAAFAGELGRSLGLADVVVVMDVYGAGEDALPGVSGAEVAQAVPLPPESVVFEPSWSRVAERAAGLVRRGDLVITMGAGDVTQIGRELLDVLDMLADAGS